MNSARLKKIHARELAKARTKSRKLLLQASAATWNKSVAVLDGNLCMTPRVAAKKLGCRTSAATSMLRIARKATIKERARVAAGKVSISAMAARVARRAMPDHIVVKRAHPAIEQKTEPAVKAAVKPAATHVAKPEFGGDYRDYSKRVWLTVRDLLHTRRDASLWQLRDLTGMGVTQLRRLRAIEQNGSEEVKAQLAAGEITLTQAADLSGLKADGQPKHEMKRGVSPRTPIKLAAVESLFKGLVADYGPAFTYVDLNAGPGHYTHQEIAGGGSGSPVKLLKALDVASRADVILVERDPKVMARLAKSLSDNGLIGIRRLEYICEDNQSFAGTFNELYRTRYGAGAVPGLIFADPMGAGKEEWEGLDDLARMTNWDVLMHYQWTQTQRAAHHDPAFADMRRRIGRFPRDFRLVTKPTGHCGFGFMFGTNSITAAATAMRTLGAVEASKADWLRV
jgi:hypothetical protein